MAVHSNASAQQQQINGMPEQAQPITHTEMPSLNGPRHLDAARIVRLQRLIGNRATTHLVTANKSVQRQMSPAITQKGAPQKTVQRTLNVDPLPMTAPLMETIHKNILPVLPEADRNFLLHVIQDKTVNLTIRFVDLGEDLKGTTSLQGIGGSPLNSYVGASPQETGQNLIKAIETSNNVNFTIKVAMPDTSGSDESGDGQKTLDEFDVADIESEIIITLFHELIPHLRPEVGNLDTIKQSNDPDQKNDELNNLLTRPGEVLEHNRLSKWSDYLRSAELLIIHYATTNQQIRAGTLLEHLQEDILSHLGEEFSSPTMRDYMLGKVKDLHQTYKDKLEYYDLSKEIDNAIKNAEQELPTMI